VEGVEMKGVGSGWSRQTCQLHTMHTVLRPLQSIFISLTYRNEVSIKSGRPHQDG